MTWSVTFISDDGRRYVREGFSWLEAAWWALVLNGQCFKAANS